MKLERKVTAPTSALSASATLAFDNPALPAWMSEATRSYLAHVCQGVPIREIARARGCHASTILRQVRKIEQQRDDLLKDEAIERFSSFLTAGQSTPANVPDAASTPEAMPQVEDDATIAREARRVLRRLCESSAFMLVSPDLPQAAVFRETVPGRRTRVAVVDREIAQTFAMKDWIEGRASGRVGIYNITNAGREALKALLAEERGEPASLDDADGAQAEVLDEHRAFGDRIVKDRDGPRRIRYNLAESPLTALARKRGPDGQPYLSPAMMQAGERLREDFEIAQIGPGTTDNCDVFLEEAISGTYRTGTGHGGAAKARDRVAAALEAMGPSLADVAFRCCCQLEGLESAERHLGWSARAGKVVLRIALERLDAYYQAS